MSLSKGVGALVALAFMCIASNATARPVKQIPQISNAAPSLAGVRSFLEPAFSFFSHLALVFVVVWDYFIHNPPLAVLLSASIATVVALRSISVNRSTVRLRETFVAVSNKNWDKDVINARSQYRKIRDACQKNPQFVSRYAYDLAEWTVIFGATTQSGATALVVVDDHADKEAKKEHLEMSSALLSILNDYEYMALGIRSNILDEDFMFKALRNSALHDWKTLGPLASAIREKRAYNNLFIEFEGLASAWKDNRSYRTGKEIKPTEKRVFFK